MCFGMEPRESWRAQAQDDFTDAELLRANGRLKSAVFHYQQAIEKALKSVLIGQGKPIPRVHDCRTLARLCLAPEHLTDRMEGITSYYYFTRYPDETPLPLTGSDVDRARSITLEVLEWTTKQC